MWWKEIVLLIALLCAPFGDGATQFDLSFVHSTNKVIVTDYYYMLEYSVVRGKATTKASGKLLIKLQSLYR